jgi:adenosylhomocysteinase
MHGVPSGAVESTRSGDYVYQTVQCPIISVDNSRIKHLEDYLGTGESFVRGWNYFRPHDSLAGKSIVLFGYGKVGRGVAHFLSREDSEVTVVEIDPQKRARASGETFAAIDLENRASLESVIGQADIIIGATGIAGAIGGSVPREWLDANSPILVNIGIDEYGEEFEDDEILGGKTTPINWHLLRPTQNRYIDPVFAALALALEALIHNRASYSDGLHRLPDEIDQWVLEKWIESWPDEDLSKLDEELGLSEVS